MDFEAAVALTLAYIDASPVIYPASKEITHDILTSF